MGSNSPASTSNHSSRQTSFHGVSVAGSPIPNRLDAVVPLPSLETCRILITNLGSYSGDILELCHIFGDISVVQDKRPTSLLIVYSLLWSAHLAYMAIPSHFPGVSVTFIVKNKPFASAILLKTNMPVDIIDTGLLLRFMCQYGSVRAYEKLPAKDPSFSVILGIYDESRALSLDPGTYNVCGFVVEVQSYNLAVTPSSVDCSPLSLASTATTDSLQSRSVSSASVFTPDSTYHHSASFPSATSFRDQSNLPSNRSASAHHNTKSILVDDASNADMKNGSLALNLTSPKGNRKLWGNADLGIVTRSANGEDNAINVRKILAGLDSRTTIMLRNIPNKVDQVLLKKYIDITNKNTYDFLYLRIDFVNKCNVGYAFINFTHPKHIVTLANARAGTKWNEFNSDKICDMCYANMQVYQLPVCLTYFSL